MPTREYMAEWRKNHRELLASRQRDYRKTFHGGHTQRLNQIARGHRKGSLVRKSIVSALRELIKEASQQKAVFQRAVERANRAEDRVFEKMNRWFIYKILQPALCVDCISLGDSENAYFETMYPVDLFAFGIHNERGVTRCLKHRKERYKSNHGGDLRRCRKFGVPHDPKVNRQVVLEKDDYRCYRCGVETPKEKRGTFANNAPEIDHVWALGEIRGGQKSPGHVYSNLRCICRKCNTEKNSEVSFNKKALDEVHKARLTGTWICAKGGDVETSIICPVCGQEAIRQRANAKYCSDKCLAKAADRRESVRKRADIKPKICVECNSLFQPLRIARKFCSSGCSRTYRLRAAQNKYWFDKQKPTEKFCISCNKRFIPKQQRTSLCSKKCRKRIWCDLARERGLL